MTNKDHEFAIALGLTFSNARPVTLGLTGFRGYTSLDRGAMSAASIVAIVPMLLFAQVGQKTHRQGHGPRGGERMKT